MDDDREPDVKYKVILIGDTAVGKTSLIYRYCKDAFSEDRSPTVGVQFQPRVLNLEEKKVKLALWDTAGQEKFRTLTKSYYRNSHGAILVYDIANPETLEHLNSAWFRELKEAIDVEDVILAVVGNKLDLRDTPDHPNCVSRREGEDLAKRHQAMFMEASAKTAEQVEQVFLELTQRMIERNRGQKQAGPSVALTSRDPGVQGSVNCC
jgi:Ras-related protein Rab-18